MTVKLTLDSGAGGTNTVVAYDTATHELTSTAMPAGVDVENAGSGTTLVQTPGQPTAYIKSLIAGSGITIVDNGSDLTLLSTSGGSYPAIYNNGSGYGNPSGINFTGGCAVSSSVYGVDVYVTPGPQGDPGPTGPQGPAGAVNDVENSGSGTAMVQNPGSNSTIYIKGLQAGSNMSITDNGSYLTLDASSSGSYPQVLNNGSSYGNPGGLNFTGNATVSSSIYGVDINVASGPSTDVENAGGGVAIVVNPNGNPVNIKGIEAGAGITVTDNTNRLTIDSAGITALSGDVTATGPGSVSSTVTAIQGHAVASTTPTVGQTYVWDGSQYTPVTQTVTLTGVVTGTANMNSSGLTTIATSGGGGPPTGAAGGDLSGTYPNPTVNRIKGTAVSATAPTNGTALVYFSGIGSSYNPFTVSALIDQNFTPVTVTTTGSFQNLQNLTIFSNAVTTVGQAIVWRNFGTWSNAATLQYSFGGVVIFTVTLAAPAGTATYINEIGIIRTGSSTASAYCQTTAGAVVIPPQSASLTGINYATSNAALVQGRCDVAANTLTSSAVRLNIN